MMKVYQRQEIINDFDEKYDMRSNWIEPTEYGAQTVGRKTNWAKDVWANYFLNIFFAQPSAPLSITLAVDKSDMTS